jgi:hypothetical protein
MHRLVFLAHPRDGLFAVLVEIPEQCAWTASLSRLREPRSLPAGLPNRGFEKSKRGCPSLSVLADAPYAFVALGGARTEAALAEMYPA